MRLKQLEQLVAIADVGSIRKAAQKLAISQPGLTKSIRALEEEFRVPMIQRTNQGTVLTKYGRAVVARSRTVLIEIGRMEEEVLDIQGDTRGHTSIAVSPAAAMMVVPGALQRLHRTNPGVSVAVSDGLYPKVLPLIREREVDFAVGPLPDHPLDSEFLVEPLFESPLCVACRVGHACENATSIRELKDAQWAINGPAHGPGSIFEKKFKALGDTLSQPVLRFESLTTLTASMLKNDVICILPRQLLNHPFYATHLRAIDIEEPLAPLTVYLIASSASPLPPAARAMADALRRTPAGI